MPGVGKNTDVDVGRGYRRRNAKPWWLKDYHFIPHGVPTLEDLTRGAQTPQGGPQEDPMAVV